MSNLSVKPTNAKTAPKKPPKASQSNKAAASASTIAQAASSSKDIELEDALIR